MGFAHTYLASLSGVAFACSGRIIEETSPGPAPEVPLSVSGFRVSGSGLGHIGAAVERRCHTRAGAVYAEMDMNVSGGSVTISESTAWEDGGSGGVGRFKWFWEQETTDPPQEVARRASWALQFWGGGFFGCKA